MGKISHRTGFTIVEVTLFLAISAFILVGLMAGTSSSIARQRYNDSVQDFTEFLRRAYSETINMQNVRTGSIGNSYSCSISGMVNKNNGRLVGSDDDGWKRWTSSGYTGLSDGYPGRSGCAFYGRLLTFGEDGEETIRSYDIIGRTFTDDMLCTYDDNGHASCSYVDVTVDTLEALRMIDADILTIHVEGQNSPLCTFTPAGNTNYYNLQWQARAETTSEDGESFVGTVMIVRSPVSGSIHTYVMEGTVINANDVITNKDGEYSLNISSNGDCKGELSSYYRVFNQGRILAKYLDDEDRDWFEVKDVDICVGSTDVFAYSGQRRNIRLLADGRNATAVELVAQDLDPDEGGNQCL